MTHLKIQTISAIGAWFMLSALVSLHARTNFVFILADDLGWRDTGFNGSSFYETPNLDALAGAGVRFT